MSDYPTLKVAIDDKGVALCTFNRPEVRNALSEEMVNDIRAVLNDLRERTDVCALIFTGAGGKAFISGADIAELRERGRMDALRRINNTLMRDIELFPLPTIAAISGYALGGGCEFALACDMRIAARGAKFGQPEVGLGILPGAGATYRLQRTVGPGLARELIFTGRIIDAETALGMGLVNRLVDDDTLLETAYALAHEIAKNSRMALRFAKIAMGAVDDRGMEANMVIESTAQAVLFEDDEKMRRMGDFLARRAKKT